MADRETELMLLAKKGDRAAFEEIHRLYQKPLLNYFFRLCRNRARAEDLIQDAFLRLWKAAPAYEPAARVSTYVFGIAHNLFVNDASRRRETVLGGADAAADDPADSLFRQETHAAVWKALRELPEGERECLVLSECHGFRYAEISGILGIPVGTVKSRIHNAVQRLKRSLRGEDF